LLGYSVETLTSSEHNPSTRPCLEISRK